ncbi:hypothetical protein MMU07_09385 [Aquiflexum sp. LQ15W]|uniref:hypothetical protein n=1 Tax=Cognataquiflexum nitidum TaxID=2922272 RepID=UPI001F12D9F7|nr:hypothetical protein [Cognataquiflexum nitidum]MCH6199793.1 hypothetical protein [Cognataquiflexum nitidum]
MRNETDKELQSFFDQLKENDRGIQIPAFPEVIKPRSINWWIPMGIAASLALGFFLWPQQKQELNLPAEVIIITLEKDENNNQQILIEEKTYLETWESPTASLLTEY